MTGNLARQRGFTLVEMLVAVVIVAILAAVTVPMFTAQKAKARDAAVKEQVGNVAKAAETVLTDGTPPVLLGDTTSGKVTGGPIEQVVTTSDGVKWNVIGTPKAYCVTAWHESSKTYSPSSPLSYDSTLGGPLKPGQPCATSTELGGYLASTSVTGVPIRNVLNNASQESVSAGVPAWSVNGGWSANAPTGVSHNTTVITDTRWGTAARRATVTAPAPAGVTVFGPYLRATSFEANTTYTASMWMRTSIAQVFALHLERPRSSVPGLNSFVCPEQSTTPGQWTRLSCQVHSGVYDDLTRLTLTAYTTKNSVAWPIGATMDVDAAMLTKGETLYPFFDGDTAGARWEGARSASPSALGG